MAKDSPRTIAGELQKKVEFWGQKTFKNVIKEHLHHHMLFGRVSRKEYSVIRHDCNFKWDWLLWSDITKQNCFLTANTQDGFGAHRDKKSTSCVQ